MIELTQTQAVTIGILFTIVGALVGALASIYAARLTAEKQQLYIESAKFIEAFISQVIALRKANQDAYKITSDEVITTQHKAKVRFEPWVEKKQIKSFHESWHKYEQSIKTQAPGSIDRRKAECDVALKQIEDLLSYTKTKG